VRDRRHIDGLHRVLPGLVLLAAIGSASCAAAAARCDARQGVYLQVLGSGGPIADDERASSAYLVWQDGRSRIMVDAGGGAFLRFGEAGARFDELDHIAISHFHTDHSADLVTFLKTGYFSDRRRPLGISGPSEGGPFPSLENYLHSLLGKGGAYGYLGGYLDGSQGLVRIDPVTLDAGSRRSIPVADLDDGNIRITGTGVPHGIVPTIAYRVQIGGKSLVFASDQNGSDESFAGFARNADVLVMHMAVPENADGAGRALHAPPGRIGEIAAAAGAGSLVLSHFMARSLRDLDGNVALVRRHFDGPVHVAGDLACIPLD
jgi:ribonuclease BN (tRNA processing enzyme)